MLFFQQRFHFRNKMHPEYYRAVGRSQQTQDVLWTITGVMMIVGLVLVIIAISPWWAGVIAALVIHRAVLPFICGLTL